jgi:hypothetical protein
MRLIDAWGREPADQPLTNWLMEAGEIFSLSNLVTVMVSDQ